MRSPLRTPIGALSGAKCYTTLAFFELKLNDRILRIVRSEYSTVNTFIPPRLGKVNSLKAISVGAVRTRQLPTTRSELITRKRRFYSGNLQTNSC
jgi:hypothetical protein